MRTLFFYPTTLVFSATCFAAPKMQLQEADRQAEAIIDSASSETALAVQQLKLPEGIEASLWAAEPMLANPVAFDFDEQGRLYVAETYRYQTSVLDIRGYIEMLEEDMAFRTVDDRAAGIDLLFGEQAKDFAVESERVRLLEDRDGDGKADFTSEFAAGFDTALDGIASGVLARKGEVYLSNIPSLWKLKPDAEKGVASEREEVLRGFGVHFGYTGHDFHGLTVGPDGKLYFSIGDRGASVIGPDGNRIDFPDTGAVYRSNFDGTELEVVHYGLRNPQELAFDELGNLFTGDNDCDNGDYERLVLIAEGGDSGWRIGHQHAPLGGAGVWMSEGWWQVPFEGQAKFLLPPISYLEDGPSGIAYYPGTGLTPDYQGQLFITHFKGSIATSGVFTYKMKPKGAWFELEQKEEFLKGVLPTDVTFAPDGKFYVLDWVNGWPKSNKGRVYALWNEEQQQSELVKRTEQLFSEGMTQRSATELAELLSHPNWNIRLEAQLELADRGEVALPLFSEIALDSSKALYPRLHATWGLGILADRAIGKAAAELSQVARCDDPELQAQAIKLLGDHGVASEAEFLLEALQSDSSRVRYFAAQSLGKLGIADATPALLRAARENEGQDPYLTHGIVMGLAGAKDSAALVATLSDPSPSVRIAAVLALRRLGDPAVASFLQDPEKEVVFEAARAINDAPIEAAFPALAEALQSPFAQDPILALRAINAHFRIGEAENAEALARFAASSYPSELRQEALTQLSSWPNPLDRDRIMGVYRPLDDREAAVAGNALAAVGPALFASGDDTVLPHFIAALDQLGVTQLSDELVNLVKDPQRSGDTRVAAFNSLNAQGDPRMDELVSYASQSDSSELRLATLPIVSERSPAQAAKTLGLMVTGSPSEQKVAYTTLAGSNQAFAAKLIAESVDRLAKGEVPAAAQLELIEAAETHSDAAVKAAYQRYQAAIAADSDPVAPFRFALEGGTSQPNGRRVFFNNQVMACVRCHIVYGPGEAAGPNLSDVGIRLSREELLESIVAPNAAIADGFDNVILTLQDGSVKAGLVAHEDEQSITLALAAGGDATVAKSDIQRRDAMPSSMPNIFGQLLSRRDLRDVMEFLYRQRTDPNGRSTHGEEGF